MLRLQNENLACIVIFYGTDGVPSMTEFLCQMCALG